MKFSMSFLKKIREGHRLPLATKNYPSRGQTAIQELYQIPQGKFFLKKVSRQNHIDCQIDPDAGTLAERESWAFCLAKEIALVTPQLWLLDKQTTVQTWLDFPDGRQYATSYGKLLLGPENVFDCALFDWVTGQIDRHDANYLYDYVNKKIILIDSAHCLLKYTGSIPDYLKYFEVGYPELLSKPLITETYQKLTSLSEKKLTRLMPLRNQEETKSLFERWKQIKSIKNIQSLIHLYRGKKP